MSKVFVGYDNYGISGVDNDFIHFIFDMILSHTASYQDYEVGLIIVSDKYIKDLNHKYREKNKTTNVLSFANDEIEDMPSTEEDKNYLGDVYISYDQLNKEAVRLKISLKERFVQLFVHGTLHLIGFDHDNEESAQVLENLEDKIVNSVV